MSRMGVLMKYMEHLLHAAGARDKAVQDLFDNVQSRLPSPSQPQSTSQTFVPQPVKYPYRFLHQYERSTAESNQRRDNSKGWMSSGTGRV